MFGLYELAVVALSILTVVLVKKFTEESSPSICNVYKRCDTFYWPKVVLMYAFLMLLKLRYLQIDYKAWDKAQRLTKDPKTIDGVSFKCTNNVGEYFVCALARRINNCSEAVIAFKLKDSKLLKLPLTQLKSDSSQEAFEAEGIKIHPIEPLKKWKIQFEGKLMDDDAKLKDVNIDLEYTSDYPVFCYDTHGDSLLFAKALAREDWSVNYFRNLQLMHQTLYEQHGDLRGTIKVDGKSWNVTLNAIRDHSFGKHRDLRQFHRYVLHYINVDNGDKISVGSVSMPIAFSNLSLGHAFNAKTGKMLSISNCDFKLYQHGEDGVPPKDYAFTIKVGKQTYVIEVEVETGLELYQGKEVRFIENSCKFRVNGRKAWGSIEWLYRNVQ